MSVNKINKKKHMMIKDFIKSNKCPICNSDLIDISNESIIGKKCPNCDYGYVATNIHEWQEDDTKYTIFFSKDSEATIASMKFIARKLQTSIIKIKDRISKEKILYLKGQAWQLKDSIKELNENNIKYEITPEFKYKF